MSFHIRDKFTEPAKAAPAASATPVDDDLEAVEQRAKDEAAAKAKAAAAAKRRTRKAKA